MRGGGREPFQALHGAGLRFVADLADGENTLAIIGTGQSGHPMSPHWDDQLEAWRAGGMRRLTRVPGATTGTLRLTP
jgi:penicillin amidase